VFHLISGKINAALLEQITHTTDAVNKHVSAHFQIPTELDNL
jgi:hypothetical protein